MRDIKKRSLNKINLAIELKPINMSSYAAETNFFCPHIDQCKYQETGLQWKKQQRRRRRGGVGERRGGGGEENLYVMQNPIATS